MAAKDRQAIFDCPSMSPIISVENLSKAYRIGVSEGRHETLAATVASWIRMPFRNFRRLRSLNTTGISGEDISIHWALKDVTFGVQQGEVVGIIGRNGAGKSTLLKILSRITKPSAGRVLIRGRVSSLLEVGTGFHPELTGRDNVYMNGTILGMRKKEIDKKFDEIVDFSGIEKFIDTPVKRYSSGMKVRLAFAVAAHLEPEILIIDEVLAVGDHEFQQRCVGKMGEVSRSGRTVLFVSHNMAAVQSLCTRGVCLASGKVDMAGGVEETLEYYQRSMNRFCKPEIDLVYSRRSSSSSIPLMTRARLLDSFGNGATRFPMCDTFRLVVDFDHAERAFSPVLGIRIKTSVGTAVFGIDNRMVKAYSFASELQRGSIEIRIDSLPLMPGVYHVDLWLGDKVKSLDAVEDAIAFEVVETDVTGTGKLPPANCGPVYQTASWSLVSNC